MSIYVLKPSRLDFRKYFVIYNNEFHFSCSLPIHHHDPKKSYFAVNFSYFMAVRPDASERSGEFRIIDFRAILSIGSGSTRPKTARDAIAEIPSSWPVVFSLVQQGVLATENTRYRCTDSDPLYSRIVISNC